MMTALAIAMLTTHIWLYNADMAEVEQRNTLEYVERNCNKTDQRIVVEGEIRSVYQCDRPEYLDVRK